jgi:hypothetical protein
MPTIAGLASLTGGTTAFAAPVSANFTEIRDTVNAFGMFTDVARTVTAVQTFSATPVCSAGISITGNLTMATAASRLVPGATSFAVRNNANGEDNLLVSDAGNVTVRGTLTSTGTITGTLATAAQPNVTSVGSLTALTMAGNLTFSGASRKIVSGATALLFRNSVDSLTWLQYTDSGNVTIGGGAYDVFAGNQTAATNAGEGFLRVPQTAGTPTGVAGAGAIVYDSANEKLYYRNGSAWKEVATV